MISPVKEIEKKIHYQRSDTLLNHIKTILQPDIMRYSGNVNSHRFVLWRYYLRAGIFYPVIYGYLTEDGGKGKIKLVARLNIIGVLFSLISGVAAALSWFFGSHLTSAENSFDYWIRKIGIGIVFGCIPMLIVRLISRYFKIKELKEIEAILEGKDSEIL